MEKFLWRTVQVCLVTALMLSISGVYRPVMADALSPGSTFVDARQEVRIAVLAFRGKDETVRKWLPTIEYLTNEIPGFRFEIDAVTLSEMTQSVRDGQVDFILTNPGNYVEHEAHYGVTRVATLMPKAFPNTGNRFGAVIFARATDRSIRTLGDLRDKRLMAINEDAFGGFQMAWRELQAINLDPYQDLSELRFVGFPQDQVVEAVLAGDVDAGTCRTGILETLAAQGKIDMADLRILNAHEIEGFPYVLSTRLYPEWPFARLTHTSEALSRQVVIALLGMEPDHPAALQGGYGGWTVPLDYQPVHDLFRELRIGPYGQPIIIRFSDLLEQYWQWGLFITVIAAMGVLWVMRVEHLVAVRTRELSQSNALLEKQIIERRRAEEIARARQHELAHISRVNTVGELTSNLAHEINQPLAAIGNYATGCVRRLDRGAMDDGELRSVLSTIAGEAGRAGEVIRRLRAFVRKGEVREERFNPNDIIREAVDITLPEAQRQSITLHLDLAVDLSDVFADKVQIEQVLLNLIGNSIDALNGSADTQKNVMVRTSNVFLDDHDTQKGVLCQVEDNGVGLAPEDAERVFEAFYSTKRDGMGMGLSISRSIVEASGGKLWAERDRSVGAVIAFTLPAVETGEA